LKTGDGDQVVTGPLSECAVGDYVVVCGGWVSHPVHKRQFSVESFSYLVPKTTHELLIFLSSGVITGVGPHFAQTLVAAFGERLIEVLDDSSNELLGVPGIGKKKLNTIVVSWTQHREQMSFLTFLLARQVEVTVAKRIWNTYYSNAFEVCKNAPYRLIGEVRGVSFSMADAIAGSDHQASDARMEGAIHDVFQRFFRSSNVWMPFALFFDELQQRLNWNENDAMARLQQRVLSQELILSVDTQKWVTLPHYSYAELGIVNGMHALMDAPLRVAIQAEIAVNWVKERLSQPLSDDQSAALEGLCRHPVSILYGGPGTGKTSLLKAYVAIVSKKTNHILCMAPTGKAAKRLSQQIGRRACTIHSMMELDEKTNALTPKALNVDVCIIDEMSMVDMMLFVDVLQMLPLGCRLVLVGDPDQLPSIGPGQVFADMIQYSSIPAYKLITNHRQVTHKGITSLAACILKHQPVHAPLGNDLTQLSVTSEDDLEATLMDVFLNRAIAEYGVALGDIQMIVPIHKGRFGISSINQRIAQHLRLPQFKHHLWVVGDRVIQCRNNYAKRIMNGDIGVIQSLSNETVTVQFDASTVVLETSDMHDVQLAYAVSIHKFQGSEAPIVILPIIKQWGFFMSTDVLYTAVTRAKTHLYVIGDLEAFNKMIEMGKSTERFTRLFRK
jgi:exodeoxyribonuclease V alpha subunit